VVRQFNTLQGLLARQAAHELRAQLDECGRDLRALARLLSAQRRELKTLAADVQAYYKSTGHSPPLAISLLDESGTALFSTRAEARGANHAGCEFFTWAWRRESRGRLYVSSWARRSRIAGEGLPREGVLLATPVYRTEEGSGPAGSGQAPSGVLLMTVDVAPALQAHLSALSAQPQAHRVWIMDRDGTILLQSEHPEMMRENIHQVKPQCLQCHSSFDYAQRMLDERSGTTTYQLKGKPRKLAAFAPMRFANAAWTVVVNAPYTEVTAYAQSSFARVLGLLGIIATAVVLASLMVHRGNVSRVRAEAAAKHWQEKHRLEEDLRRSQEQYHNLFEQRMEEIRQEAATKSNLLHDVNHRVKNNLMRLVEIVRLEREHAAGPEEGLKAALGDLESRLQGMAVVHSMLSGAQWRPLPLSELAGRIVTAALSASPIRQHIQVSLAAPPEPLWAVPEQATALALVLNELATNSVKHAFQGRTEGRLEVRLAIEEQAEGRTRVRLEYRDDGPGWPEAVLNGQRQRVGLRLIRASVRSPLRGDLRLLNEAGAAAVVSFQLAAAHRN
jgi:two-component sensor histidine kinase